MWMDATRHFRLARRYEMPITTYDFLLTLDDPTTDDLEGIVVPEWVWDDDFDDDNEII